MGRGSWLPSDVKEKDIKKSFVYPRLLGQRDLLDWVFGLQLCSYFIISSTILEIKTKDARTNKEPPCNVGIVWWTTVQGYNNN